MTIYVIDTETTGLNPVSDRTVEIAAVEVRKTADARVWEIGGSASSYVNPRIPIPPEASAVHHIIDSDVADAPDMGEAIDRVLGPFWRSTVDVVAAHNASFDKGFLPPLRDVQWICTYRCAMHVWRDAPRHGNQVLRYWLGLDLPRTDAHRALNDATVTAHILCRLLAERPIDELLRLSHKAALLRKVSFGKHVGKIWTEVPTDYLEWAARQDFEPDVKLTVKTELRNRK